MYNEKILAQLNSLDYLTPMKKSTVNVVSKRNAFGDSVKFYAQIDDSEVITKISYKASGCTYFLVFCNYFCSIVEGKTLQDALKINSAKLEAFVELDDSKRHVIDIILATFALLVKKYRKQTAKADDGKDDKKTEEKKTAKTSKPSDSKSVKSPKKTIAKKKDKKKDKAKESKKETRSKADEITKDKVAIIEDESKKKQATNILALKSMVKNTENSKSDDVDSEQKDAKLNTLNNMIHKLNGEPEEKPMDSSERKLNSLQQSLSKMRNNNHKE
ncbi:MAG: iron-sulfur cluster assembly scaffold protein [Clostridiales bacterium]|nr:iron-sulfur cluster assembly scaffold protein [Clostridiales bacterium]